MGWTSKNVLQQGHFNISYLEFNVLQRHVKLPDNLDTSTFKRPQTCKKGISLSLKVARLNFFRGIPPKFEH